MSEIAVAAAETDYWAAASVGSGLPVLVPSDEAFVAVAGKTAVEPEEVVGMD